MTFKDAVFATATIRDCYRKGLQALEGDARRIQCADPRKLTGSVNLDGALRASAPTAPRWDYGIGLGRQGREVAVWVEVHPASSASLDAMLEKLSWLRSWLRNDAPELNRLTKGDYYWVATDGRIAITPESPQAKRLAAAGLRGPKRVLNLD